MEGGPPMFRQDFTCPALLERYAKITVYRAITLFRGASQLSSTILHTTTGLIRFRSPLLAESRLMSFPLGT